MAGLAARRLSSRCVQSFGNILKLVFYLDIFLRPRRRYRIPAHSPPLLRSRAPRRIPRIVWLTNYTSDVTLAVYVNYLFNRTIAPTHEFRFCGDAECEAFIRNHYPQLVETYLSLQIGAAKADLWRVLVLLTHGGIYLDIDAALSWPPEYLLGADQSELFVRTKDGRLTNYFLAAEPAHPVLAAVACKVVDNITSNTIASVYDMTGPTVVDLVAGKLSVRAEPFGTVCRQGQFTKKSFQYPDALKGYWAREEEKRPIVRTKAAETARAENEGRDAPPRSNSGTMLLLACAIVVAATIARGIFITTVDLRVDEAYYWTWSKENVLSYLDHPPLIAWLIRLSTDLFGDRNFGVRFPGLLAMALMQLLLGGIVWRVLRDLRYVIAVVLMTEASLAYGLGMAKITPDVALIPCELGMLWSLIRLAQSNDHRWWLAAGFFGGFALLAKYTAVLLIPAIAAFVLVPPWRKEQLASTYLWLALGIAFLIFSPVLTWNAVHDWASFRFQLDRTAQVPGWTAQFLLDFVGQQFALVGFVLFPVILGGTAMLAARGYRKRDPISMLLSTAVLFPLSFFLWHGLSARIGDSWPLFVWPVGFICAAINLKDIRKLAPNSQPARIGPALMVVAIAFGLPFTAAAQIYYICGTANYLKRNDPIGKEAGFAGVATAANLAQYAIGAKWFATTDYRIYSMLRWHLRDKAVPVVQVNERRRYVGFAQPVLDGAGLYVAPETDPDAAIMATTSARLQYVGQIDVTWRGVSYDTYLFQKLTNWKPVLSPPANDPFERAHPH